MSRWTAAWLSCAATVLVLQTLGLDSRYTKQIVFVIIAAYWSQPDITNVWVSSVPPTYLQYGLIVSSLFLLGRWLLAMTNTARWTGPGKVLLFPCKTTHSRLFPKKHSFVYSYLVVGLPVGWEGVSGGLVSSSSARQSWLSLARRGWYHVDPEDYLERGGGHLGLRGKLDAYLKSQVRVGDGDAPDFIADYLVVQGADPVDYPHAYLVTAARFLGYHFNPASFWYLYSADLSLTAMIVEVNNTFDERRMYFLTPEETLGPGQLDSSSPNSAAGGDKSSKPPSFKHHWPKDFHVSPFNSRKGSYSLLASDPLRAMSEHRDPIDTTITLKSSKGHGKIVARLVSEGHAIEPSSMSIVQKAGFLLSWWWVGFVTFPRIVREAGRLWFQRQLHVWYRPEPLKESMGRHADATEQRLELMFRRYLRSLVEQCQAAVAVKYIPSGISDSGRELMLSPSAKTESDIIEEMEFKVLTPAFYSRFVFYAHDLEALFSELRESSTIWISRPNLLPKLLFKKPTPALQARSPLDFAFFEAIRYLRQRPEKIVRPLTSSQTPAQPSTGTSVVDIRDFRISSMDAFVLCQEDKDMRRQYRSLVLRLFIADRLAFGTLLLVDSVLVLFQTWLAWMVASAWQGRLRVLGISMAMLILRA